MLREAMKDRDNKYFALLSGECIPLFTYRQVYRKITSSKKSRVSIDMLAEVYVDTGLYYADQWVILNRKQADLLIKLKTTEKGKKFIKRTMKKIGDYCADEILPVNWFIEHYGKPSTSRYKKEIRSIPTTYTYWDNIHTSPKKFTTPQMEKLRKKICTSKAVFGRKFNAKAARELAMTC